jgi:hypothetical protein
MAIKRYVADADTTITNAYKENLIIRATGSNMGASDSMEIFSIFAQATSASLEKSRILVKFPVSQINSDRASSVLPSSGSVNFFLKLYNAKHPFTLPKDYTISVYPMSQSWVEGYGLDMESYTDPGFGVLNGYGANWELREEGVRWADSGSSFYTSSYDSYKQDISIGTEDLEIDVTKIVEDWIGGSITNNGFMVKMSGSFEDGTTSKSFYTKKFFARGTQYFFKRPIIEARWDSSITDDRTQIYSTSSLLSDSDNKYNIYFYNRVNGRLKNIPNSPSLSMSLYSDENFTNQVSMISCSVTNPSVGIYKANFMVGTTASALYDRWYNAATSSIIYYSGSFDVYKFSAKDYNSSEEFVFAPVNLKTKYGKQEVANIKLFSRLRNWSPNIYSVAKQEIENTPIKNLYYKIFRIDDGYTVFDYSTGSIGHTKTSYDSENNYFSFDMSLLEPDYSYGLQFARFDGVELEEFKQIYKFRVE